MRNSFDFHLDLDEISLMKYLAPGIQTSFLI